MFANEVLLGFFVASVLLSLAPGPDNLFVLAQSALGGRGAGLAVTLGLSTGLIGHTTAVAIGVAAIFQSSAFAFHMLKLIGASYLLYLAWGAFRASSEKLPDLGEKPPGKLKLYRRGIIMNLTNPKVSLFFLAFLPQFTDPEKGALTLQIMALGGIFMVATLLIFGAIAFLAGSLGQWITRSEKGQRILNRVAGVFFAGLALTLIFT